MEKWQAHYKDKHHDIDCFIENFYNDNSEEVALKLTMDGVTFWSDELDDWELSESETKESVEKATKKFSLFQYGDKEKGYRYRLEDYTLSITIPTEVWELKQQKKLCGELHIVFSSEKDDTSTTSCYFLDGKKVFPETVICKTFALSVKEDYFEAKNLSTYFEISLQSICKEMAGKYYLCNCFGCLYSDYSPYGNGNLGNLYCFVENAETYLQVIGKYKESPEQVTIWEAFDEGGKACQETGGCERFAPRTDCLGGYRGLLYT